MSKIMIYGLSGKKKKRSIVLAVVGFVALSAASLLLGIEFSLGLVASTSGLGFLLWDGFRGEKPKKDKGGMKLFLKLLLTYTGAAVCGLLAAITMSDAGFPLPIAAMTGFTAVLVVVVLVKLTLRVADREKSRNGLKKKKATSCAAAPSRKHSKR